MMKSKKALSPVIVFTLVLGLIIFVAFTVLGTGLVSGSGSQLYNLIPAEIELSGDKTIDEGCISGWDCMTGAACVDNVCVPSTTYSLTVHGKDNCYKSYDSDGNDDFYTKRLTEGLFKKLEPGKYQLEVSVERSGTIYENTKDLKKTTQRVYVEVWTDTGTRMTDELGDFPYEVEDNKNSVYFMHPSVIYEIEGSVDFRVYGWYKDSNCDDNAGSVTIRIDKIE